MLTNFNSMLKTAYAEHYAVGSFNVYNYETMRGVVDAALNLGCESVITAFGAKYLDNMSLEDAYALAKTLSESRDMRVCLHLDHCSDMKIVYAAIRAGFGSVMYDGSALPFEQNAANTARICDVAHACGVSVEAELGSLAAGLQSHEGDESDREVYTDPKAALEFVKTTGTDALAVSVGTVHGMYKAEPNIRLDILSEIDSLCKIPLVLHGGSGVPENTISECIARGVAKINVNTEISSYVVGHTVMDLAEKKLPHLSVLVKKQRGYVQEVAEKYIRFFEKRS
ncbi:MAG: class II fructose-bisphosphate aldolase [Oscillospiraceae bacterium]